MQNGGAAIYKAWQNGGAVYKAWLIFCIPFQLLLLPVIALQCYAVSFAFIFNYYSFLTLLSIPYACF